MGNQPGSLGKLQPNGELSEEQLELKKAEAGWNPVRTAPETWLLESPPDQHSFWWSLQERG